MSSVAPISEDIATYLASHGLQVHRAGGREVTIHCPFCLDGDPRGKGKCYLNTESWLYECKRCGESGNRRTLMRHFGDTETVEFLPGSDPMARRRVLEEYTDHAADLLSNNEKMMLYLLGRGLSAETIVEARLGYIPKNWGACASLPTAHKKADLIASGMMTEGGREYFSDRITIPYLSRNSVLSVRGKDPVGKYFTAAGDSVRLYGIDDLQEAEDVLIVEGEFDRLVVRQALRGSSDPKLRRTAVVGLPGAGAAPQGFDTYFKEARRVYIALDPDDTGKRFAVKLKETLGSKARLVELPEDLPKCDWTEFLRAKTPTAPHGGHTWHDVADLMSTSAGRRIFSVREAGAQWRKQRDTCAGIKLGFTALDAQLEPGLQPGQVCIPLAKTGCIQGDALIAVNRGGKGFTIKLKDLVDRWEGRKYAWDHSTDTYVQREVDGQVRLGRLVNAWCSGTKTTYTVTTETGRTIRATDEHPFLTERGWLRLDELVEGDLVHVRGQRGGNGRSPKPVYAKRTVPGHPYAGRRNVKAGGHSVPLHRLVAEAGLNGLDLDTFLDRCRQGLTEGLAFLDPTAWAVHHIDHDPSNNDPGNLKVLTHPEHGALHAVEGAIRNVQINVAHERVVSVVLHGEEVTYDLEVADDPHNFMANGFVVHNTGKTLFLANVAYNARSRRQLFISLEMQAGEVYNLLQRITKFWHPFHSDDQIAHELANIGIVDENRLNEKDVKALVEEYAEEYGGPPELIHIDYLGYLARGMRGGDSYERTGMAVMEVKAIAKGVGAAVIAPHQVNRGAEDGKPLSADDARDSGVIEETGDFVFGLFKPDEAVDAKTGQPGAVTGNINCSLLKSRHGGKGRVFGLKMSAASLVIVDPLNRRAVIKVEQENARINRGERYEDILATQSVTQLALTSVA